MRLLRRSEAGDGMFKRSNGKAADTEFLRLFKMCSSEAAGRADPEAYSLSVR